jgi:hypothetical protein
MMCFKFFVADEELLPGAKIAFPERLGDLTAQTKTSIP